MTAEFTTADPVAIARSLLDLALEALTDQPPVTFVGHGDPAAPDFTDGCDNEQLTVHLVRMTPKLLNDSQGVNRKVAWVSWVCSYALVLWRCVPVFDPPIGATQAPALDAAYADLLKQGTDIGRHLSRKWAKEDWPEVSPCRDVLWGNLEPIAPSGGIAGWRLNVSVQL